MMFVLVLGATFTFSSCGDDAEEDNATSGTGGSNTSSALVGAWSYNDGGEVFELLSNGVFNYYDNYSYSNGTPAKDNWTGTWSYNESSKIVTVKDSERGQTYTAEIVSITGTSIEVVMNGSKYTMSKVSKQGNATTSRLVGNWVGSITIGGSETFGATIQIKADGTYVETSAQGYNSFSGTWTDNKNGTLTLTGFFEPTFIYTINGNNLTFVGNGWSGSFTKK